MYQSTILTWKMVFKFKTPRRNKHLGKIKPPSYFAAESASLPWYGLWCNTIRIHDIKNENNSKKPIFNFIM